MTKRQPDYMISPRFHIGMEVLFNIEWRPVEKG